MPTLTEMFTGFGSAAILIIVGWLFGRNEIVDKRVSFTLNMVVFWIAMSCMLAHTLATADSASIFGSTLGAVALSALGMAAFCRIFVAPMFKQRGADAMVGAMSSSYNNVANLGVPTAVAMLHDATAVVPALVLQVAFYAFASMTVLEILTNRGCLRPRNVIMAPSKSPIFLAMMVGLAVNAFTIEVSRFIMHPMELLGQTAVPMALPAFGISPYGVPFMEAGRSPRRTVVVVSTLKLFLHLMLTLLFGRLAFDLSERALLAAVIIVGLPTVQNVYAFASRLGWDLGQARGCGMITAVACLPTVLLFTLLLS